jgi:hypothetical protein
MLLTDSMVARTNEGDLLCVLRRGRLSVHKDP